MLVAVHRRPVDDTTPERFVVLTNKPLRRVCLLSYLHRIGFDLPQLRWRTRM